MPLRQFSDSDLSHRILVHGLLPDRVVSGEVRVDGPNIVLVLESRDAAEGIAAEPPDSRLAQAVEWCFRASWQTRAMLQRAQRVHVLVPAVDLSSHAVPSLVSVPPLGRLIRPLFADFRPNLELRQFQRSGVSWLLEHQRGILADDMGLGKTLQVLEAIRELIYGAKLRTALVVCPRGLASTWVAECGKWAPELVLASSTTWQDHPEALWSMIADYRLHVGSNSL